MVWPGEPGMLEPGLEQILSDDDLVGCKKTHTRLSVMTTSVRQSVSHDPQPPAICTSPPHSSETLQHYVWLLHCMSDERELQTLYLRFIEHMKYSEILTCHLMIGSFICKFAKWMSASALWFYVRKNLMPVYGEWTVAAAGLNVA